jgi:hypothetical protein
MLQRTYFRRPDFLYPLKSQPGYRFIVGEHGALPAIAGVLGSRFVLFKFDAEGRLLPGGIQDWPTKPIPEEAQYLTGDAFPWFSKLAKKHSMTMYEDECIRVKRFFIQEGPIDFRLKWAPGPVDEEGRCPFFPVGIDDVHYFIQAHRMSPEKYSPEEFAEQEKRMQEYWNLHSAIGFGRFSRIIGVTAQVAP